MLKRIVITVLMLALPLNAWAIKYKGDLETNESLTLPQQGSTPANPAASKYKLYMKDDGQAYTLDSSGNENPVDRAGFKNYLINGNFRLWQRGVSFTAMNVYGADRWKHGSGGTATVTRQAFTLGQTDVPGEPKYFLRNNTTVAGVATATIIRQRVESVRTLAGEKATWSYWAKCGLAKSFNVFLFQNFGTGGSPSGQVVVGPQAFNCTTSWAHYVFTFTVPSVSGKTIGTNGDDFIEVLFQEASSFSTFTVDLAQAQLEKGSVATEFENRSLPVELGMAMRFFEKSYSQGTDVGTATTTGSLRFKAHTTSHIQPIIFKVTKCAVPTMTAYDSNLGGTGTCRDFTASADRTVAFGDTGDAYTRTSLASTVDGNSMGCHWTADAEF